MGQQSPGSYSMFDREYEVALFEKLIQHTAPSNITMILGPRSSGKTTVLKHCIQRMKEGEFKPIYIDCRQRKMTDPAVLIKLLREQGAANAISLKGLAENKIFVRLSQVLKTISGRLNDLTVSGSEFVDMVDKVIRNDGDNKDINETITFLTELVERYNRMKEPEVCVHAVMEMATHH